MRPKSGIAAKACWKTVGRVMNTSEAPLSGLTPTLNAAGKIIRPARMATSESTSEICTAEPSRLVCRL